MADSHKCDWTEFELSLNCLRSCSWKAFSSFVLALKCLYCMKQSSPSRPVVMNCLRKVFRGLLGLSPSSINAFSTVIYSEGVQHFLYWASSISPRPVFFLSFSFLSVSSVLSFFCSEAERNVNSHYLSGWVSYNLFLKWSLMVEYEVERSQTPWSFRYFISGKRQVEMTVFPTHIRSRGKILWKLSFKY